MADVFIAAATRTPFGRYGGRLAALRCDDLAAVPLTSLIERYPGMDWGAVDDVILGCANQAGEDNRNVARMAALLSGFPETVPAVTVNRLCASGLEAVGVAARAIAGGDAQLVLAGGADSTITAGNASGINDGACVLLLASAAALERYGLQPLARVISMAAAGVAPRIMGIGPVPAIHKLLANIGLRLDDFDRIEINEAFAAQVLACTRSLGLADNAEHVNGNGGAIALGHPLGASGARLVLTAAYALRRHQQSRALVSLCVGVGQ